MFMPLISRRQVTSELQKKAITVHLSIMSGLSGSFVLSVPLSPRGVAAGGEGTEGTKEPERPERPGETESRCFCFWVQNKYLNFETPIDFHEKMMVCNKIGVFLYLTW